MRIQRVVNGDMEPGLTVEPGTEVFVRTDHGVIKVTEDPATGVLSITPMWGAVAIEPRD